ncbi:MAG: hypothetical protein SX243_22820 [Acidobacteriota bacterium]|nr:hypothetical protein [Acidobacteriota bacterium]
MFHGRGNTTNFDSALRLNQRTGLGLLAAEVDLELPEGEFVMAVGLRDEATGESSFLATTLAIQPPGKDSKKKKNKGRR